MKEIKRVPVFLKHSVLDHWCPLTTIVTEQQMAVNWCNKIVNSKNKKQEIIVCC